MEIHRGATRTVFLIGRFAVKIPGFGRIGMGRLESFCHGYLANLSERRWSGYSDLFCPCRGFMGFVVVMPRCSPVMGEVDWEGLRVFDSLTDAKAENVGVFEGRVVWIDYA